LRRPISLSTSGWIPCTPRSKRACSPASLMDSSTSSVALATTSSMRPGWIRPSPISFSRDRRHFAAYRVESGQDDRFGGVVDDQVDAGGGLQGADIAPFATDDATFHLIGRQRYDRYVCARPHTRRHSAEWPGHDLLGLLSAVSRASSSISLMILAASMLGLILHNVHELFLGFRGRHAGDVSSLPSAHRRPFQFFFFLAKRQFF